VSRLAGIVAGIVYVAAALAYVIAVDTNYEANHAGWLAVLAAASLALGWTTGLWRVALLALVLVPLAVPFDYPESRFSEPLPTYFSAVILTPISAGLILLGVGARKVKNRHRSRHHTPRAQDLS
jgi:hypothetical protein